MPVAPQNCTRSGEQDFASRIVADRVICLEFEEGGVRFAVKGL
jgi:hypothetical protein